MFPRIRVAVAAMAWASMCLMPGSGHAQETAPPTADTPTDFSLPFFSSVGTGSSLGGRSSTSGVARRQGLTADPFGPAAPVILAPGIAATVNYTSESAGNPSGGIKQGAAYAGQIFAGLDFDLHTLLGLDGTAVHFAVTQRHGISLSQHFIGNNTSVQEIYGTQNLHLALLTLEQKFLNDRLDIEVGRTVANVAFLASPIYCNFQSNATCGNPTFVFKDSNFTYFPAVSWGGHARYQITDKIFVHVGAYEVNPADKLPTDHGFNFSTAAATGAIMPFEIGYGTSYANDDHPRHYIFGGWYDASQYSDPYRDAAGNAAVLSGLPYATHFGRSALYGRFDQMIWRPDPDSPRGLIVFGVVMDRVSGDVQENQFYEAGLLQVGTLPGRETDTIGLLFTDQVFSGSFLNNIRAARTSVGGSPFIPNSEIMLELNYGFQLNDAVRLVPNLQFVINPDQASVPFRTTNIPDAFVIGGKLAVDISSLTNYAIAHP